jgi:hypothetical protein
MGFIYEPGPMELLDPAIVPEVEVTTEMVTVVTPSVAQLFEGERVTDAIVSQAHGAGVPDYNGETAHTLRPAYDEIGYQMSTEHELSLGPAISAVAASMGEADRISADLPSEDSDYYPGVVPGEGSEETPVDAPEPPPPPSEPPIN